MGDLSSAVALLPLVAAGASVGFLVGLTGVGGGSLMTPLLISSFGISPQVAVGTDLLYASITKTAGSWRPIFPITSTGRSCSGSRREVFRPLRCCLRPSPISTSILRYSGAGSGWASSLHFP